LLALRPSLSLRPLLTLRERLTSELPTLRLLAAVLLAGATVLLGRLLARGLLVAASSRLLTARLSAGRLPTGRLPTFGLAARLRGHSLARDVVALLARVPTETDADSSRAVGLLGLALPALGAVGGDDVLATLHPTLHVLFDLLGTSVVSSSLVVSALVATPALLDVSILPASSSVRLVRHRYSPRRRFRPRDSYPCWLASVEPADIATNTSLLNIFSVL